MEVVGTVENGIVAFSMSYDQEVAIVISGSGSVISMTPNFDPLHETKLHMQDFGESKPITVGWGKEETQFQGSAGKLASRPAPPPSPAVPRDDLKPRISWRGDGEYFVTSSMDPPPETPSSAPAQPKRVIRVWNRECRLQATNDSTASLEQCLAWRPAGNIIAGCYHLSSMREILIDDHDVV